MTGSENESGGHAAVETNIWQPGKTGTLSGVKKKRMKQKSNQADLFKDQPQNADEMENKAIELESRDRIKKLGEMSKKLKFLKHGSFNSDPDSTD